MSEQPKGWAKWDNNEFYFGPMAENLLKIKPGEKIGNILDGASICPVNNATCIEYIEVEIYGINLHNSEYKTKKKKIWLCPFGAKDIDHCTLSK